MKRYFFVLLCLIVFKANSQQTDYRNKVKLNITAASIKMLGLQYERKLNNHFSVNANVFIRPQSLIPFGVAIDSLAKQYGVGITGIKFKYIDINKAKVGVMGFSPEIKYYFGRSRHKNFIGIFAQSEFYNVIVPASLSVKYTGRIAEITTPINFSFNTITGGISIGKSFELSDRLSLDVVFIGPHIGKALNFNASVKSDISAKLSADDKLYLKDKIIERFGLYDKYFAVDVNADGAFIKSVRPVPYVSTRALGINLAYKF